MKSPIPKPVLKTLWELFPFLLGGTIIMLRFSFSSFLHLHNLVFYKIPFRFHPYLTTQCMFNTFTHYRVFSFLSLFIPSTYTNVTINFFTIIVDRVKFETYLSFSQILSCELDDHCYNSINNFIWIFFNHFRLLLSDNLKRPNNTFLNGYRLYVRVFILWPLSLV